MKLSRPAITILSDLICDDKSKYLYRTQKDIEKLFYGNTSINFDSIPATNRKGFTFYCLENCTDIEKILREITDYRIFSKNQKEIAKQLVTEINDVLRVEKYKLELGNSGLYKLSNLDNKKIVTTDLHREAEILSSSYIEEHLLKTENKLKDKDFSGAITNAKSLVEQVIRDLSKKLETDFVDNDLGKSFKNVQTKMNMNPKDYEHNGFKQILTGLISIVSGIAEVRNKTSDSHSRIYNPSEHHAILVVNSARTICSFLVDSYKYQKSMKILGE